MSGSSNALVAPRGLEEGRVEQLVDRLVGRRGSPEDALLRRFLIGCDLIAFLAVVFSVPQAALRGEWLGAVVVAVFGIALLILASLVRFAIALPLVVWVHFLTSSAFFFFISIQSDELRAEQLAWLVLLPLCAVATTRTARRHRFAFTVTKATILAVVVGGAIVAANAAGLTFHQKVERDHLGGLGRLGPAPLLGRCDGVVVRSPPPACRGRARGPSGPPVRLRVVSQDPGPGELGADRPVHARSRQAGHSRDLPELHREAPAPGTLRITARHDVGREAGGERTSPPTAGGRHSGR